MNNIDIIANELREGGYINLPDKAANDAAILAGEYAWVAQQLSEILSKKSAIWLEMRKNHKSDTSCEREYQTTSDGIKEIQLKLTEKSITKMMSALRSIVRICEQEARNII